MASLQELSAQLLVAAKPQGQASEQSRAQGSECLEAKEKVHVIMNRLRLLLRQVSGDLQGLEKNLEATDKQQVSKTPVQEEENDNDSGCSDTTFFTKYKYEYSHLGTCRFKVLIQVLINAMIMIFFKKKNIFFFIKVP